MRLRWIVATCVIASLLGWKVARTWTLKLPDDDIKSHVAAINSATVAFIDGEGNIYCTGTFVNDTDIVTAKHCLIEDDEVVDFLTTFGLPVQDTQLVKGVQFITRLDYVLGVKSPGHRADLVTVGRMDVALLRVAHGTHHGTVTLKRMAPSVGDDVATVGHTQGLGWSYAQGHVSCPRRYIVGPLTDKSVEHLQVTSELGRGNSGGGMFDERGRMVGVVTFILDDVQSMSFSVSSRELIGFLTVNGIEHRVVD